MGCKNGAIPGAAELSAPGGAAPMVQVQEGPVGAALSRSMSSSPDKRSLATPDVKAAFGAKHSAGHTAGARQVCRGNE